MKLPKKYLWRLLVVTSLTMSACHNDNNPPPPPPATEGSATIDSRGGTVEGPDGVQLVVPAGALDEAITIRIARSSTGAPALPDDLKSGLPVYEITPHNLNFKLPVTVRLPSSDTPDEGTTMLVAEAGGEWQSAPVTISDGYASVNRVSLSWYVLVPNLNTGPVSACSYDNDPYICIWPIVSLGGDIAVSPPEAAPNGGRFPTIVLPAELSFPIRVSTPRDCENAVLTVYRDTRPANSPATAPRSWQQLLVQPITLTPQANTNHRSEGSYLFSTQVNAGENSGFGLRFAFSCRRTYNNYTYSSFMETLYRADVPQQPGAPSITQQPQPITVFAGSNASSSISATAPDTLAIQWQRSNDSGATWNNVANGNSFSLTPAQLADNGAWIRASVCNVVGASTNCINSNIVTLSVTSSTITPAFTQQPASQSVIAGQTASFTVVASGTPAPAVQWYKAGTPDQAVGTPCPPGSGTTSCTYTTGALALGDSGNQYYASATNSAGTVQSNTVTLTVTSGATGPSIDINTPADVTAAIGSTVLFSVQATGTAPLSYQWYRDGNPITGANAATYSLSNVQPADYGAAFAVAVSNGEGAAFSRAARLTVIPDTTTYFGNWGIVWPLPHGNTLTALAITGGEVYAAGPFTTMVSTDSGATWTTRFDTAGIVALAAPANGVLVGTSNNGGIYRSSDGGQSWSKTSNFSVSSIAFADAANGVALVGMGDVYRTTDGGLTWAPAGAAVSGGVKLAAVDSTTYVALGSGGLIARSSDGGISWTTVRTGSVGVDALSDVKFANASLGIAVGIDTSGYSMLRTTDGGMHWTAVTSPGFVDLIAFANATTVVAMSGHGRYYRSTDGGLNWSNVQDIEGAEGIGQVRFATGSTGYAVGMYGQIFQTTDGGEYWSRIAGGSNLDSSYSVGVSPSGIALAAGGNRLFGSSDGGRTWRDVAYTYMRSVAFTSDNTVVGTGYNGKVWRSTDGGANWNQIMQDTTWHRAVDFAGASTGVIVGESGRILRTTDGGQSWQAVNSGVTNPLTSIRFLSSTTAYAGGDYSTLLRTTDGGATWTVLNLPGAGIEYTSVNGIVTSASGDLLVLTGDALWRSSDSGSSWTKVFDRFNGNYCDGGLGGIAFTDANHGLIVGAQGCMIRSTDGGATWTRLNLPVTTTLNAVTAISNDTFVVVGDGGLIMRNTQDGAP